MVKEASETVRGGKQSQAAEEKVTNQPVIEMISLGKC